LALACVIGAACAVLLLAGGGTRRIELVGGLLPLKQGWSDAMDHESVHQTVVAPHRSGHRIFAPLDEPVMHSITSDIPNMDDSAMEPTNNYEDKLNRKLLRLQREKAALAARKQDIMDGLISDRYSQQQRVAADTVVADHQRLRDALVRARQQQWGDYAKASQSYAAAKVHSTMRADEYLKRRSRVMSRIKKLDDLLSYGDGQTSTEREVWHKEWMPYQDAHAHAHAASAQNEDLDDLLTDIQGQAEAMGDDTAKMALLDKVKQLHNAIKGGAEKRTLTIPDKRSWRKMSTDLDTYSSHLEHRDPLDTDAAWAWNKPRSSSNDWRRRDEMAT